MMTSLRNISVFWILFYLQAILSILCNNSKENAKIKLRNIFGVDFGKLPANGVEHVWKINAYNEKFEPEDYSGGFQTFKSNETYFILAKKRWSSAVNLYYWAGKETSLEDKKTVGKYAIMFYHFFYEIWDTYNTIIFSREYETLETESFQHIIHKLKGIYPPESRNSAYSDHHLPLSGPNLYIVKGRESTRVKKVTFSLKWIKPNICLIVDPSGHLFEEFYYATIWCGKETNEKVNRRVREFARKFCPNSFKSIAVATGVGVMYKRLIELLEDDGNNRPSDVDTSSDDKIDEEEFIKNWDKSVTLFKLSKDHPNGRNEVEDRPIHTEIFSHGTQENFLFDSNSTAGLFFITGYVTDIEAKIWAVQYAEEYLNSQIEMFGKLIPMKIMSTFPLTFHFDFMINMIDLPYSRLLNGDPELW